MDEEIKSGECFHANSHGCVPRRGVYPVVHKNIHVYPAIHVYPELHVYPDIHLCRYIHVNPGVSVSRVTRIRPDLCALPTQIPPPRTLHIVPCIHFPTCLPSDYAMHSISLNTFPAYHSLHHTWFPAYHTLCTIPCKPFPTYHLVHTIPCVQIPE